MKHTITTVFDFGDNVNLVEQEGRDPGIVVGYILEPGYRLKVLVRWDQFMDPQQHYEFELQSAEERKAYEE